MELGADSGIKIILRQSPGEMNGTCVSGQLCMTEQVLINWASENDQHTPVFP